MRVATWWAVRGAAVSLVSVQYPGPAVEILAHGGGDEPLEPLRAGTLFHLDLNPWLSASLLAVAIVYLYAVWRLERRGDRWPALRTVAFLIPGLGGIASVTLTGVGTYDTTLLSVHMVQHMVLSMIAPIFLALGAPVTLALRTLPQGARRVLLSALHSRVAKIWTYPLFAYGLFIATPFALYFTGLYRLTLSNNFVHELVHVHFILVGCLFFWPLLGMDPLPGRWPYPGRAMLMFLSTPFHTVLGLTVMQSTTLLGGDWYPSLHLGWADPFTDQQLAGGILWAGGEVVSVTMLAVLVAQWMRQAEREARRVDRQLDREEAAARSAAVTEAAAGTEVAAVAAGAAPETAAGTGRQEQDGYDPLGSRDTQGASGR
ncbi:MAG: cytochrome c oxidase assembly protein [Dactylosporangium sp.]|nr:cytochrome c oxidase assembly protein [Dactylosporangium sp.]